MQFGTTVQGQHQRSDTRAMLTPLSGKDVCCSGYDSIYDKDDASCHPGQNAKGENVGVVRG